ncbi:MAG TPA: hypothetical protein VF808_03990 [Ktedonobacterales bacterium]
MTDNVRHARAAAKPGVKPETKVEAPERPERPESGSRAVSVWQFTVATVAALLIGALYLQLPDTLLVGPRWLLLALEVVLLAPPVLARVFNYHLSHRTSRWLAYGLLAALTAELIASLTKLVLNLPKLSAHLLVVPGMLLWAANILVFANWYWETDGDGPVSRHHAGHQAADFQFPQQQGGNTRGWRAGFIDYLFLAFCTATALSPADTVPLSRRAKLLMMVEAVISMVVIVMLLARFVNIV